MTCIRMCKFLERKIKQKTSELNNIPYGNGAWKIRIQRNAYLDAIDRHKNRMSYYQDSQDGILLLHRNAIQHLPKDYSVVVVHAKVQV